MHLVCTVPVGKSMACVYFCQLAEDYFLVSELTDLLLHWNILNYLFCKTVSKYFKYNEHINYQFQNAKQISTIQSIK